MKDWNDKNANLETKRTTFFLLGLVLTLSLALYAFEWKSYKRKLVVLGCPIEVGEDDEIIPITQAQNSIPPQLAPPEFIHIVDDSKAIVETGFEPTDFEWDDEMEIIDEIGQETDEIFVASVVENKPVYPGCENLATEAEKFNCFNASIIKHIGKNFKFPKWRLKRVCRAEFM